MNNKMPCNVTKRRHIMSFAMVLFCMLHMQLRCVAISDLPRARSISLSVEIYAAKYQYEEGHTLLDNEASSLPNDAEWTTFIRIVRSYLIPIKQVHESIDTLLKIRTEPVFNTLSPFIKRSRLFYLAKLQNQNGQNNLAITNLLACMREIGTEDKQYTKEVEAANDYLMRITSVLVKQTDGAMQELRDKIAKLESDNDYSSCIFPCLVLSVRYSYQNKYGIAQKYGEKALTYQFACKEVNNVRFLNILGQLCVIYGHLGLDERYDSCVRLGNKVVNYLKKEGTHKINEFELGVLAGSYELGRYEVTYALLDSLERELGSECSNRYQLTNVYKYRSELAKQKGNLTEAREQAYKRLHFATQCNATNDYFTQEAQQTIIDLLAMEKKLGNTKEIYALHDLKIKYDSFEISKSTYLKLLNFWSDKTIQHERSKVAENKMKSRQIIGLLGVIIAIIIGFTVYRQKLYETRHKMESYKNRIEISYSKMNPHFTFNVLTGVQDLILRDKKEEALEYVAAFSKITRNIFDFKHDDLSSISDELKFLNDYMVLEKGRFGDHLSLISAIDDTIDPDHTNTPRLLYQPIVENSIKHGLRKQLLEGHFGVITINITKAPHLIIKISDNGSGFPLDHSTKANHSISVVMKGLELMYSKSGFKLFEYNLEDGGACTEIHLYKILPA